MADVNPHLMVLLARPGAPAKAAEGGEMAPGESAGDDERGLNVMAQDLIDAVHSKDSAGVVSALKAFNEACEMDEGGGDEAGEPADEGAEPE